MNEDGTDLTKKRISRDTNSLIEFLKSRSKYIGRIREKIRASKFLLETNEKYSKHENTPIALFLYEQKK